MEHCSVLREFLALIGDLSREHLGVGDHVCVNRDNFRLHFIAVLYRRHLADVVISLEEIVEDEVAHVLPLLLLGDFSEDRGSKPELSANLPVRILLRLTKLHSLAEEYLFFDAFLEHLDFKLGQEAIHFSNEVKVFLLLSEL